MFSCSSPWMICEMRPFQKYTFVDHGARFLSTYFNTHSNKFVVASFHAINGCVTTWRSRCPSETSRIPFHSCSIYMVFSRYRPQLAFVRYPWPQLGFSLRVSIKFPYAFGGTTQPSGPVCAGGCERPCLRSQKAPLMDTATLADGTFFDEIWWRRCPPMDPPTRRWGRWCGSCPPGGWSATSFVFESFPWRKTSELFTESSSPFKFKCSICWMPLQGQNPG